MDGSDNLFENLSSFFLLWSIYEMKYFIKFNINSRLRCCFLNAALRTFCKPFLQMFMSSSKKVGGGMSINRLTAHVTKILKNNQ